MMKNYALGLDDAPVACLGEYEPLKSIGNSTTTARDMLNVEDARQVLFALCDSVAARMREHGVKCGMAALWVKDNQLCGFERQMMLPQPTNLSKELFDAAFSLLQRHYSWHRPIRALGVRGGHLIDEKQAGQMSLFSAPQREKQERLERTLDEINARFSGCALRRAVLLRDASLDGGDIKNGHGESPLQGGREIWQFPE